MPHRLTRFESKPEPANDAALADALPPFIERFVREDKRARALQLFVPRPRVEWRDLIPMLDTWRARTFTDGVLVPWHATRGVFLVEHDAYSVDTKTALELYVPATDALFVAYGGIFAFVRSQVGEALLFT